MIKEMNAFHPDFMKTYYPDFMKEFRTNDANREEREDKKLRVSKKPLKMMTKTIRIRAKKLMPILTKAEQGKSMAEIKAELLKPREYRTYSKAGANK